ncbi:Pentatricopeptide repeat-containing protein [Apostasia shenzhenica]|uniref:Pentatricopeptide repeat-containing protein n=1 Tax=Apostasia shenzhenica TaxID=1088818 RepID=A0A2I0AQR6_9ASPA|nr:Pentatricopeptide repeat-containing protein [Apostasia shenzhenica]
MRSMCSFYAEGTSVIASYLDSDLLHSHSPCRRRRKLWGHANVSLRAETLVLRHGFLSISPELSYHGRKQRSLCRPFAGSLSVVHNPEGFNHAHEEEESEKERVDVRGLAGRLQEAKAADDVEEVLKDFEALPLPVYSSIIRGFGMYKKLDPAFAVFEWLKMKGKTNLFIYNSLLGSLKQSAKFDKIVEVMKEMKSQGIFPNIVTYNTLMSVYLDQGKPQEALSILNEIESTGLSLSPATYSIVLHVYRKLDDAIGAIRFFVKFREEYEKGYMNNDPDYYWKTEYFKVENFTIRICYLVMRQHLVNEENSYTNFFKILTEMDKVRLKPGRVELERLIWACTHEAHYIVARELYQRIREVNTDISLSVCNHVIWLMGKAKKWWAALEIYEELLDKGPEPNNLSYELIVSHFNVLLNAARRKGIWRWGVRLINKMLDKGLRPGIREWNAVLVACSKASEASAAVQIFKRMIDQGEKPSILSYGALLSALEKGKLYDEALRVWDHMCKVGIKPNLHAYTILASVYIGKGMPEMVDSIVHQMCSSKIEPSIVTFNAIITGFARNQMSGPAFEWYHRMKVRNIKPNEITYEMLIEALTQDGKPRLALDMYLRATNEGLHLSAKSYDTVLESCQVCGTIIDMNVLGQRPQERKRSVRIRGNLTEFCDMANLPRRSEPFDRTEIYTSEIHER